MAKKAEGTFQTKMFLNVVFLENHGGVNRVETVRVPWKLLTEPEVLKMIDVAVRERLTSAWGTTPDDLTLPGID